MEKQINNSTYATSKIILEEFYLGDFNKKGFLMTQKI
jgi:hypothetical protein